MGLLTTAPSNPRFHSHVNFFNVMILSYTANFNRLLEFVACFDSVRLIFVGAIVIPLVIRANANVISIVANMRFQLKSYQICYDFCSSAVKGHNNFTWRRKYKMRRCEAMD
ncbi:uncharacterized protein LOC132617465 [Lycium barbarum]|uniref:uncharacterized protein LOC132617465 n=1 Tax=Lycium barbarum TaxID=112863 RepID=UPI00293E9522|nr:uncharacterized protein LOC132617465 [Lycium barbarum]